ncbi:MAG: hypothetical protein EA351_05075 [Gemmatimonadales bacterium]|nr:MAG: hypothetical protein EA351_05075 [Gemmatimonadales bacterium]
MVTTGLSVVEAARETLAARERGATVVVALLLEGPCAGARRLRIRERSDDRGPRDRSLGELGHPELEEVVDGILDGALDGEPLSARSSEAGTRSVLLPGATNEIPVYLERTRPPSGLLIVGAGHIAEPLHLQGALLGFRVTVADDRPDFVDPGRFPRAQRVVRIDFSDPFHAIEHPDRSHVILVTRGHRYDYECLRRLVVEDPLPEYIGMIGSRRRVRATFHQLLEEGVPRAALERIRAPVGLDLGAETPGEIAVAVAAEWVAITRGGSGRPMVEVERVAERFFPNEADDDRE